MRKVILSLVLSASVLSVVSCNREEDTSSVIIPPTVKPSENKTKEVTLNVEKATDWKYFSFEAGKEVSVTNPATDKSWDVAFLAYMVKVNGGASTTVDAKGEVYRTEQKDFSAVKEVPADAKYTKDETGSFKYGDYSNLQTKEDSFNKLISGGFKSKTGYVSLDPANIGKYSSVYAPNQWVYIVKTAQGKIVKLQVSDVYGGEKGTAFGYPKFTYQFADGNNKF